MERLSTETRLSLTAAAKKKLMARHPEITVAIPNRHEAHGKCNECDAV